MSKNQKIKLIILTMILCGSGSAFAGIVGGHVGNQADTVAGFCVDCDEGDGLVQKAVIQGGIDIGAITDSLIHDGNEEVEAKDVLFMEDTNFGVDNEALNYGGIVRSPKLKRGGNAFFYEDSCQIVATVAHLFQEPGGKMKEDDFVFYSGKTKKKIGIDWKKSQFKDWDRKSKRNNDISFLVLKEKVPGCKYYEYAKPKESSYKVVRRNLSPNDPEPQTIQVLEDDKLVEGKGFEVHFNPIRQKGGTFQGRSQGSEGCHIWKNTDEDYLKVAHGVETGISVLDCDTKGLDSGSAVYVEIPEEKGKRFAISVYSGSYYSSELESKNGGKFHPKNYGNFSVDMWHHWEMYKRAKQKLLEDGTS